MRTTPILMLAAALWACGGDDGKDAPTGPGVDGDADTDADADSDTDSDADVDCSASIAGVTPIPGDDMVPLDQVVTVDFTSSITAKDPWSVEITGVKGTSALAGDGFSATFTPSAPLAPETNYDIDVSVCDDSDASSFTTLPQSVDPADVENATYGLNWVDVTITEPVAGALIKPLIPIDFIMIQLDTILPSGFVDAVATLAYNDKLGNPIPDCSVAVEETADFSLNPLFSFGPSTVQLVIDTQTGATADLEDFTLLAEFSPDGSSLTDIRITALVATEEFIPGEDCNTGALVQLFSPQCLPCAASPSGTCMLVEAEAALANIQPAIDLYGLCGL